VTGLAVCHAQRGELAAAAQLVQRLLIERVSKWLEPSAISEYSEFATADSMQLRYDAGHKFWLAKIPADQIVGMLEVKGSAHVLMLFVHAEFQRRGVARALLRGAFPGFPNMRFNVTVNSIPQSIPAYERMGFVRAGEEQNVRGIRFVPMTLPAFTK
jgi:ribosomal protein S18 acetylase RimI-like enzyme